MHININKIRPHILCSNTNWKTIWTKEHHVRVRVPDTHTCVAAVCICILLDSVTCHRNWNSLETRRNARFDNLVGNSDRVWKWDCLFINWQRWALRTCFLCRFELAQVRVANMFSMSVSNCQRWELWTCFLCPSRMRRWPALIQTRSEGRDSVRAAAYILCACRSLLSPATKSEQRGIKGWIYELSNYVPVPLQLINSIWIHLYLLVNGWILLAY